MAPLRIGKQWQMDPRKLQLRPYDGTERDLAALARVRNETLQAITPPDEYVELAPQAMHDYYDRGGFTLTGNAWLIFHGDEPVAAAIVYPMHAFHDRPPGNFHLYVVPSFGRHGLGGRLLDHLERAAVERGHPVLETTIAREDSPSTTFLLARGFAVVGHSIHLARAGLTTMPPAQLPPGYSVRSLAALGEPPDLYRETTNRLGAYYASYSLITPEGIDQQVASPEWDPAGVLFLFDPSGRIVGIIRATVPGERRGYLSDIRIEPASRGKGLGRALVAEALSYLVARGVQRAELDTPGENAAAHRLALATGFEEVRHWLHFMKSLRSQVASLKPAP